VGIKHRWATASTMNIMASFPLNSHPELPKSDPT
jgi:hypothetical protein